jgi:hypothetical protein
VLEHPLLVAFTVNVAVADEVLLMVNVLPGIIFPLVVVVTPLMLFKGFILVVQLKLELDISVLRLKSELEEPEQTFCSKEVFEKVGVCLSSIE